VTNNEALRTFISSAMAGDEPKYVGFTENCVTAVPEPSTTILALMGGLGIACAAWRQTRRACLKTDDADCALAFAAAVPTGTVLPSR
jgi:hypothetical protein